jgi:hypothetical protein
VQSFKATKDAKALSNEELTILYSKYSPIGVLTQFDVVRDPPVLFQEGMQHFEARQYQQYYVIMRALSDRYPSMHDVCCVIVILDLV